MGERVTIADVAVDLIKLSSKRWTDRENLTNQDYLAVEVIKQLVPTISSSALLAVGLSEVSTAREREGSPSVPRVNRADDAA